MNNAFNNTLLELKAEAYGSEKVYTFKHVQDAYGKAQENADLEDIRLHDLRHTFATRLVQAGVDVFTVQRILGHSTITMTMRYCHSFEARMRDVGENLDEKLGGRKRRN
jgi:site-specific recombinase XerD